MSNQLSSVLWLFVGFAMVVAGLWGLLRKLPAERRRERTMVAATGTVQDGLQGSNVFKQLSNAASGPGAAAVPMVAFTTHEGREIVTRVGVVRSTGGRTTALAIGERVALRYDPADPTVVMLDVQPSLARFTALFCAGLLASGGILAYVQLRDLLRGLS